MPGFAVRSLLAGTSIKFTFLWTSEVCKIARAFLQANHKPQQVYNDVRDRPAKGEFIHLLITGPPCTPWARGGKRRGDADIRARLLDESLPAIEARRPWAVLLEESNLLMTASEGHRIDTIVVHLKSWDYQVHMTILNSKEHGLPQNRPRLYLVALHVRCPLIGEAFVMPTPLPANRTLALKDILGPPGPQDDPAHRPRGARASANVDKAAAALPSGDERDWMVRQATGKAWTTSVRPQFIMPCLLHGNTSGYWVGSRGHKASRGAHSRAQGLCDMDVVWPKQPSAAFALLGNSMSKAILERILHRIFRQWGLLSGPDPWETGAAQRCLKKDAVTEFLESR